MTRAEYIAKYGVAPGAPAVSASPTPAPTPSIPTQASTPVQMTRAQYQAKYGIAPATPAPAAPEDTGGGVGGFLKGLVSAPATLIARPIQLAAEIAGATPEEVNKYNFGGIVAPVPENTSDVVKDVGRGVQTVALGTGAPLAGGAAFGFGNALEQQGSKAVTTEGGLLNTALQTGTGLAAGKLLDFVAKPIINKVTGVVKTFTPLDLQKLVSKGTNAVSDFMAQHEIVPTVAKEAINSIPKAAESFDKGVGKLFSGAGSAVKGAVQSQYPGMTAENAAKHYENIEIKRLMEPATAPGKTFNKSADVYKDAQKRGIDLSKTAADNKVYASEHITDGKFDTKDVADALANETMSGGPEILRPALAAAEPGVPRVHVSEIRSEIMNRLKKVPDAKLSPEQKLKFAKNIAKEYGVGSVTDASHPDGYSLTNLYDSKLQTGSNLYKGPKNGGVQSIADNLTSQQKQIESQVFDSLLRKNAPPELGLDKYFKAQEGRFALANYLRTLDGNKAPQTLFQRGVRRAAQLGGATTGATVAGPFGMFSGYQFGGIVADTFANASNPVKVAFLKSIGKTEPEIYAIMKEFTSDAEAAALSRQGLPAPGGRNASPDLQRMQNAQGAVEMGYPQRPTTAGDRFNNNINQNSKRLFNTKALPAPKPRIITPNTQGTPNKIGRYYGPGGDQGEVGGLRQRTKPKK